MEKVTGRRLTGTSTGNDNVDEVLYESGALTMGMMLYYVAKDFKNTFEASPNALSSANDTEKVLIVILMYSGLWSIGFIFIGYLAFRQYQMKIDKRAKFLAKVEAEGGGEVKRRDRRSNVVGRVSGIHDSNLQIDTERMRTKLSEYVISVIPGVFNSSSVLACMKNELLRHHSYLRLLSRSVSERLPTLTVAELLTTQTLLMFLLAVLYDVQGPSDDGSCAAHQTHEACKRENHCLIPLKVIVNGILHQIGH